MKKEMDKYEAMGKEILPHVLQIQKLLDKYDFDKLVSMAVSRDGYLSIDPHDSGMEILRTDYKSPFRITHSTVLDI